MSLPSDQNSAAKLFAFAKELGVETIVTSATPASLSAIDKLAGDSGVNVAVAVDGDPKTVMDAIGNLSPHVGVSVDFANWIEHGIKPVDGLGLIKDRLMVVRLRDRNVLGANGRDVPLWNRCGGPAEVSFRSRQAGTTTAGRTQQMCQLQPAVWRHKAAVYRPGRRPMASGNSNRTTTRYIRWDIRRAVAACRRL